MHRVRQFLVGPVLLGILVALTGCTYRAALQRLSPEEQVMFRIYSKGMTSGQAHTYLRQATAAERAAYLEHLGLAQRFQALSPWDREAVLSGFPRQGISADALRFLWGEPYYTRGSVRHAAHWHYLGSPFTLVASGNQHGQLGTMVDVYILEGRVAWWQEYVPSIIEDGGNDCVGC